MCKLSVGEFFLPNLYVGFVILEPIFLLFIFFSSLILSVSCEKIYFGKSCGSASLKYLNTNLSFLSPFLAIVKSGTECLLVLTYLT